MRLTIEIEGERFDVEVQRTPQGVRLECEDRTMELAGQAPRSAVELEGGGQRWRVELTSDEQANINGRPVRYHVAGFSPGGAGAGDATQTKVPVRAAMHGRLVKVIAKAGQGVRKGEALFVLEAMKMQNELASPADGTVAEVVAKAGDVVDVGRVLAWLERGAKPQN